MEVSTIIIWCSSTVSFLHRNPLILVHSYLSFDSSVQAESKAWCIFYVPTINGGFQTSQIWFIFPAWFINTANRLHCANPLLTLRATVLNLTSNGTRCRWLEHECMIAEITDVLYVKNMPTPFEVVAFLWSYNTLQSNCNLFYIIIYSLSELERVPGPDRVILNLDHSSHVHSNLEVLNPLSLLLLLMSVFTIPLVSPFSCLLSPHSKDE